MDATARAKISKLLPMLSSDQDGEVVAAARAIGRALKAAKADWHDLAKAISAGVASEPQGKKAWYEPPYGRPEPYEPPPYTGPGFTEKGPKTEEPPPRDPEWMRRQQEEFTRYQNEIKEARRRREEAEARARRREEEERRREAEEREYKERAEKMAEEIRAAAAGDRSKVDPLDWTAGDIIREAQALIDRDDDRDCLTQKERSFVVKMRDRAQAFGSLTLMSAKQRRWLKGLSDIHVYGLAA